MFIYIAAVIVLLINGNAVYSGTTPIPKEKKLDKGELAKLIHHIVEAEKNDEDGNDDDRKIVEFEEAEPLDLSYFDINAALKSSNKEVSSLVAKNYVAQQNHAADPKNSDYAVRVHLIKNPEVLEEYKKNLMRKLDTSSSSSLSSSTSDELDEILFDDDNSDTLVPSRRSAVFRLEKSQNQGISDRDKLALRNREDTNADRYKKRFRKENPKPHSKLEDEDAVEKIIVSLGKASNDYHEKLPQERANKISKTKNNFDDESALLNVWDDITKNAFKWDDKTDSIYKKESDTNKPDRKIDGKRTDKVGYKGNFDSKKIKQSDDYDNHKSSNSKKIYKQNDYDDFKSTAKKKLSKQFNDYEDYRGSKKFSKKSKDYGDYKSKKTNIKNIDDYGDYKSHNKKTDAKKRDDYGDYKSYSKKTATKKRDDYGDYKKDYDWNSKLKARPTQTKNPDKTKNKNSWDNWKPKSIERDWDKPKRNDERDKPKSNKDWNVSKANDWGRYDRNEDSMKRKKKDNWSPNVSKHVIEIKNIDAWDIPKKATKGMASLEKAMKDGYDNYKRGKKKTTSEWDKAFANAGGNDQARKPYVPQISNHYKAKPKIHDNRAELSYKAFGRTPIPFVGKKGIYEEN